MSVVDEIARGDIQTRAENNEDLTVRGFALKSRKQLIIRWQS